MNSTIMFSGDILQQANNDLQQIQAGESKLLTVKSELDDAQKKLEQAKNDIANKEILVTTIIGVAGCAILLITVFTVRAGMAGITNSQYHELQHYDGTISIDQSSDEIQQKSLRDFIETNSEIQSIKVCEQYSSFVKDDEYHYATILSSKDQKRTEYLELIDVSTGKSTQIPDIGVLISKKCAEEYNYAVGEDFVITDSKGNLCTAVISGIFERNIGNAVVISSEYYNEITGEDLNFNQYFVKLLQADKDALVSTLQDYKAFAGYTSADLYVEEFNNKLKSIDSALIVILFVTFLLSVFVILNLAVMNITQKQTEITVMKVLGVSPWRIKLYVLRETMLMSFAGLIVGTVVGAPIGAFITRVIELEGIQNIRGISLSACIIGMLICILFFTATNLFALIKIRHIKTN